MKTAHPLAPVEVRQALIAYQAVKQALRQLEIAQDAMAPDDMFFRNWDQDFYRRLRGMQDRAGTLQRVLRAYIRSLDSSIAFDLDISG